MMGGGHRDRRLFVSNINVNVREDLMAKKKTRAPAETPQGTGTKVSPMSDRVIVRFDEAETMSPGGIVLPAVSQEKSQFATVTAVGPGRVWTEGGPPMDMLQDANEPVPRVPLTVKEGDRVLVSRYAGIEFELGGSNFTILREEDILAVCGTSRG
jgi:chaperonin GroES